MKRRFKKLASCIIVFVTLINLFTSLFATPVSMVLATDTSSSTVVNEIDEEDECISIYTLTEKELLEDLIRQNNKPYKIVSSEYVARVKGVEEEKIDYMLHQGTKEFDSLHGLNFNIKTKTIYIQK